MWISDRGYRYIYINIRSIGSHVLPNRTYLHIPTCRIIYSEFREYSSVHYHHQSINSFNSELCSIKAVRCCRGSSVNGAANPFSVIANFTQLLCSIRPSHVDLHTSRCFVIDRIATGKAADWPTRVGHRARHGTIMRRTEDCAPLNNYLPRWNTFLWILMHFYWCNSSGVTEHLTNMCNESMEEWRRFIYLCYMHNICYTIWKFLSFGF